MSLDTKTLDWLARRQEGRRPECGRCAYLKRDIPDCSYVPPYLGEFCYLDAENQDWADVAEFEARVQVKMAELHDSDFSVLSQNVLLYPRVF